MKNLNSVGDMLARFDDSKRAVANLMAREQITVQVIEGAKTATFNPKDRILTIPNWTNLTIEQADVLMCHEIGHALFTDRTLDIQKIPCGLFTYMNVIEDARIERRTKNAFPGTAATFFKGYREFHANGPIFQGTVDALFHPTTHVEIPVAGMKLIDKINIHYKIGAFLPVTFTTAEKVWLTRIDKCCSTVEALQIAKDMQAEQRDLAKQEQKEDKSQGSKASRAKGTAKLDKPESADDSGDDKESTRGVPGDDNSSDDSDLAEGDDEGQEDEGTGEGDGDSKDGDSDGDSDGDDSASTDSDADGDSDENGAPSPTNENAKENAKTKNTGNADDAADTVDAMLDTLAKLAAERSGAPQITHLLYSELNDTILKGRTITAKDWADMAHDAMNAACPSAAANLDAMENDWNAQYLTTARHMGLEFERRKNAKCLMAAKTAKSGKLDLTKLAQYRFTEDLFKRSISVPNGKSHGVVMLIDGSGSMSDVFANVVDQTLLFAQFAFQVSIPFEAYMFSDCTNGLSRTDGSFDQTSAGMNSLTLGQSGRLIGLINTSTSRAGFKRQVRAVLALKARHNRYSRTSYGYGMDDAITSIPFSGLGGTPLFTGIMIAERHLARMKNQMKLDKTTFIVITDGEDTNNVWYQTNAHTYNTNHKGQKFASVEDAFVVRDTVTKKNLSYVKQAKDYQGRTVATGLTNGVLTMLLDIIKLRHGTRTIYIYLQNGSVSSLISRRRSRYRRNYQPQGTQVSVDGFRYLVGAQHFDEASKITLASVKDALRDEGQYCLPKELGVADLAIILPAVSVGLTENAFSKLDTTDMSQKKVAVEFVKASVKAVSNRRFVNSVIPYLA